MQCTLYTLIHILTHARHSKRNIHLHNVNATTAISCCRIQKIVHGSKMATIFDIYENFQVFTLPKINCKLECEHTPPAKLCQLIFYFSSTIIYSRQCFSIILYDSILRLNAQNYKVYTMCSMMMVSMEMDDIFH